MVNGLSRISNNANPNGVNYGSRAGLTVASGGNATLLQANANQMIGEMMKDKLVQAAAIGARLIAPPGGRRNSRGVLELGMEHRIAHYIYYQKI